MDKPTYLSLFSGIGGLDLGLDRAGWTCVGQVERDEFCRRVLARHWPEVPRHDDVRTAPDWWLGTARPAVDLVCGGPPCQPFSQAGLRRGIADERWGWPWMFDVVRAIRPRYVLVENVAALLRDADAFGWVLRDLAELGFDAQWDVLSACAVGAPHPRERVFLVAHADRQGLEGQRQLHHPGTQPGAVPADGGWWATEPDVGGSPDGISAGLDGAGLDADAQEAGSRCWSDDSWEDGLARVAHGVPARVDRLRGLGNAVVPQVGEHIGRLILAHAGVNR